MILSLYVDKYVLFLNKEFISNIDFNDKSQVEVCFKNLFEKIKKRLGSELNGFFDIKVYLDDDYGCLVMIEKEDVNYYEYLINQVDMQIEIENVTFYQEFNDYFIIPKSIVYLYKGKYYKKATNDIKTLEFVRLVYGKELEEVLKFGKKIVV